VILLFAITGHSDIIVECRLRPGQPRFNSRQGQWWDFFSSPPPSDRLWGLPSLLSNGDLRLLPRGLIVQGVKMTTHLHLVPNLRMRGAIPPLPNTSLSLTG